LLPAAVWTIAESETNLRRERQLEGIAKAKVAGVYKGRPASIDAAQVRQLKAQGLGATEIAKALSIGRASVYRALGGHRVRRRLEFRASGYGRR
jgi:DNA invertase Pin-like site-specific DNA recombinase